VPNRAVLTIAHDLCDEDGVPGAAHRRALAHRAHGGAGVVMTDLLAVERRGRVTPRDSGMFTEAQEQEWAAIVAAVHAESDALVMARLGHAGARGATAPREQGIDRPLRCDAWPLLAASARPHTARAQVPEAMDRAAMDGVVEQFRAATERAARAGFDMLELHAGHGYLLAGFLSPLTNHRTDDYGGPLEHRMRFPLEVFSAVAAAWPDERPLCACLTADDWVAGGTTMADAVAVARELKARGCDLIHLVAGQTVARSRGSYRPHFLSGYAEWLRNDVGMPVMIRGRITSADEANTVLAGGRADLCILDLPGLAEYDARLRREAPAVAPAREAVASAA
jgi:anthraniloyl-CoA monooxygenase